MQYIFGEKQKTKYLLSHEFDTNTPVVSVVSVVAWSGLMSGGWWCVHEPLAEARGQFFVPHPRAALAHKATHFGF